MVTYWELLQWPYTVEAMCGACATKCSMVASKLLKIIHKERVALDQTVTDLRHATIKFRKVGGTNDVGLISGEAASLQGLIDNAYEKAVELTQRETDLGEDPNAFAELDNIMKNFSPFFHLWTSLSDALEDLSVWKEGSLWSLEPDNVVKKVNNWIKETLTGAAEPPRAAASGRRPRSGAAEPRGAAERSRRRAKSPTEHRAAPRAAESSRRAARRAEPSHATATPVSLRPQPQPAALGHTSGAERYRAVSSAERGGQNLSESRSRSAAIIIFAITTITYIRTDLRGPRGERGTSAEAAGLSAGGQPSVQKSIAGSTTRPADIES